MPKMKGGIMYTILVTKDNELLATEKTAIMQRSTMVDKLRFLVPKYRCKVMSGDFLHL